MPPQPSSSSSSEPSQPSHQPEMHSAFFYGTLMAPSVLHRVISSPKSPSRNRSSQLTFHPALLPNHKRRRVAGADYPAVTPYPPSARSSPTRSHTQHPQHPQSTVTTRPTGPTSPPQPASSHETSAPSVRGTLVTHLTPTDLAKLDLFEGNEYERRPVKVRLLSERVEEGGGVAEPMAYGGITPAVPWGGYREGEEVGMGSGGEGEMGDGDREAGSVGAERAGGGQQGLEEWVDTQTYIWIAPESELEDGEWDFEHFRREKLHLWAGAEAVDAGMMEADAFGSGGGDGAGRVDGWQDGTRGRGVVTGEFERAWEDRQREGEEVVRSAV